MALQGYLEDHLERSVLDEVDVWLPHIAVVVEGVEVGVPDHRVKGALVAITDLTFCRHHGRVLGQSTSA